jgi:hypothetical protein
MLLLSGDFRVARRIHLAGKRASGKAQAAAPIRFTASSVVHSALAI